MPVSIAIPNLLSASDASTDVISPCGAKATISATVAYLTTLRVWDTSLNINQSVDATEPLPATSIKFVAELVAVYLKLTVGSAAVPPINIGSTPLTESTTPSPTISQTALEPPVDAVTQTFNLFIPPW